MRARIVLILTIVGLAMALSSAPVAAGSQALFITKVGTPDPVAPGGTLTYTITIENTGVGAANGVVVTDTLPAPLALVDANPTSGVAQVNGQEVMWTVDLATGASETLTIATVVDAATPGGTIILNEVLANFIDEVFVSASAQTTVLGASPTPAASLADAATAPPATGSPLATLGFGLLLIGALGALLVANARGVVRQ
jgi:uncharacterized repeat protein (TIGR01451 family)